MSTNNVTMIVKKNVLPQLKAHAEERTKQAIRTAGLMVIAESDPFTPVDTGALKGSANMKMDGEWLCIVYWGVFYAIYVHEGTRYMAARPFAVQGVEQVRPGFVAVMKECWNI